MVWKQRKHMLILSWPLPWHVSLGCTREVLFSNFSRLFFLLPVMLFEVRQACSSKCIVTLDSWSTCWAGNNFIFLLVLGSRKWCWVCPVRGSTCMVNEEAEGGLQDLFTGSTPTRLLWSRLGPPKPPQWQHSYRKLSNLGTTPVWVVVEWYPKGSATVSQRLYSQHRERKPC